MGKKEQTKNEVFDPRIIEDLRRYKVRYPELNRIKEFQGLTPQEIAFVWWVAYPGSPLLEDVKDKLTQRFAKAANKVWGNERRASGTATNFKNGVFNEKVKAAMNRMSKIEFDARRRSAMMVDKMLDDYEKVIQKGFSDGSFMDSEGNLDIAKYTSATSKIRKELPDIIKTKEEGFSIIKEAVSSGSEGQDPLEAYLSNKKEATN